MSENTNITEVKEADYKVHVIAEVCAELAASNVKNAAKILNSKYPFEPFVNIGRRYSPLKCVQIFRRDGFIDRYSGLRLVFPGALRIISHRMPDAFPFHKNGKTDECHFAYWELFPTIDHRIPVSRGGLDDETNFVTTSMAKNAAKANFTLDEIGWELRPSGDVSVWDGEMSWFISEVKKDPTLLELEYVRIWYPVALRALKLESDKNELEVVLSE